MRCRMVALSAFRSIRRLRDMLANGDGLDQRLTGMEKAKVVKPVLP